LPPTGGDIRVLGHSLLAADGLEVAQAVMGVCPQFDVLWDELSGQEHMYIYGCIKGLPSFEVRASTDQVMVHKIGQPLQRRFFLKLLQSGYMACHTLSYTV
jgi:ABC-type multidrug transport system ATPase subunit